MSQNLIWGLKLGPLKFFSWVLSLLNVRNCCKLSSHAICRKTFNPNSRKWRKTSFWAWFRAVGSKFGLLIFFFQKCVFVSPWISWSTIIMYNRKKLMIRSWENLVMDWQTDESDFIRRCLTNVERPIKNLSKTSKRSYVETHVTKFTIILFVSSV